MKFSIEVTKMTEVTEIVTVNADTEEEAKVLAIKKAHFTRAGGCVSYSAKSYDYVDQNGNPYIPDESYPVGGGLHRDCEFNADAIVAYNYMLSRERVTEYLTSKGFFPGCQSENYEEWLKGNTCIIFEEYDAVAGQWAYLHTELV